jgi:hypothetical protein
VTCGTSETAMKSVSANERRTVLDYANDALLVHTCIITSRDYIRAKKDTRMPKFWPEPENMHWKIQTEDSGVLFLRRQIPTGAT